MSRVKNRGVAGSVDTMATPNSGAAADRRITLVGSTGKFRCVGLCDDLDITGVIYFASGDATVNCASEADAENFVEPKAYGEVFELQQGATHVSLFAGTDFTIVYGEVK